MTLLSINFSHPWLLLLIIPALTLTLIPYFRSNKKYRRNRNRVISITLHTLVMTLCILLFAGLTFSYKVPNKGNELLILVDCSYSGNAKQDEKNEFVQSVIDESGSDLKVGVVKFGYNQIYAAPLSYDRKDVYNKYIDSNDPDSSATDVASALKYAQGLFSNPHGGKILLVSDGIETDNTALAVIKTISAEGIRVDTAFFPNDEYADVQIIGVKTPEYNVNVGDKFNIEVTLQSNIKGNDEKVTVKVYDNDEAGAEAEYKLIEGVGALKLEHSFALPGLHRLRFEIKSQNDTLTLNNTYFSYVNLQINESILILERYAGEADELNTLLSQQYDVTVLNVEADYDQIPRDLIALCDYQEVILVNISNGDLQNIGGGFDELLNEYVYTVGGGLFTVGGSLDGDKPHAYNRDDMINSLYQQMLPVQVVDYTPPVAVMILVDTSGSMGSGEGSPMQFAKNGAKAVFDILKPRDFCGIIAFNDTPDMVLPMTAVSHKSEIEDAINSISNYGSNGTVYTTAIQLAGEELAGYDVDIKHIILVSDGQPGDEGAFEEEITENAKKGITMSMVIYGSDYGENLQNIVTELGKGKFYNPSRPEDIAVAIESDLTTEAVDEITYGEPYNIHIADKTPAVAGLERLKSDDLPKIYGYYGTQAKEGAEVPLKGGREPDENKKTPEQVPIYAQWKYGEGTVGSFLCDLSGLWSKDFVASAEGQRFINNVTAGLFPTRDIRQSDIKVVLKEDNYTNQLNVYTSLEQGESIRVNITPLTQEAIDYYRYSGVEVIATEGYSRFTFGITVPGLYEVQINKLSASGEVLSSLTLYKALSYSEEYNTFTDKTPIGEEYLKELASSGKGTLIEDLFDVFDSFERVLTKIFDPRLLFLILAIVFFILDIAVRKFKFKWIHELVRERRENKQLNQDKT